MINSAFLLLQIGVKITRSRLCLFYFSFDLLFLILFLEQLGLGSEVIGHVSHNLMVWSQHWSQDSEEQSRRF